MKVVGQIKATVAPRTGHRVWTLHLPSNPCEVLAGRVRSARRGFWSIPRLRVRHSRGVGQVLNGPGSRHCSGRIWLLVACIFHDSLGKLRLGASGWV